MKYFACLGYRGILVRAAESREGLTDFDDWREVVDIHAHVNERGLHALDTGKLMTFTKEDQSYPQLAALFS